MGSYVAYGKSRVFLEGEYTIEELKEIIKQTEKLNEEAKKFLEKCTQS